MKKFKVLVVVLLASLLIPTSAFAKSDTEVAKPNGNVTKSSVDFSLPNLHQVVIDVPTGKVTKLSTKGIQPLGAGTWDKVGKSEVLPLNRYTEVASGIHPSKGGDFQVRVEDVGSNNTYAIQLYEHDPSGDVAVLGAQREIGPTAFNYRNISSYVDGSNGEAEFYITIGYAYDYENATVSFYD